MVKLFVPPQSAWEVPPANLVELAGARCPRVVLRGQILDRVFAQLESLETLHGQPLLHWSDTQLDNAERVLDVPAVLASVQLVQQQLEYLLNQDHPSLNLSQIEPLPYNPAWTMEFYGTLNVLRYNLLARIHALAKMPTHSRQCPKGETINFWYYPHIEKYLPGGFYHGNPLGRSSSELF